jgi:hypothetical protein
MFGIAKYTIDTTRPHISSCYKQAHLVNVSFNVSVCMRRILAPCRSGTPVNP